MSPSISQSINASKSKSRDNNIVLKRKLSFSVAKETEKIALNLVKKSPSSESYVFLMSDTNIVCLSDDRLN